MKKVIAAINMTIDGVCDHTAVNPDEEIHEHYTNVLANANTILYGRITYQLMEFWKSLIETPSGKKSLDDFAVIMNKIQKIVFSKTLQQTNWSSAILADQSLEETVKALKITSDTNILVGSRSLIIQLLKLNLIDEFQICVHPIIAGTGLTLFEQMNERLEFTLLDAKVFTSGATINYYQPVKNK